MKTAKKSGYLTSGCCNVAVLATTVIASAMACKKSPEATQKSIAKNPMAANVALLVVTDGFRAGEIDRFIATANKLAPELEELGFATEVLEKPTPKELSVQVRRTAEKLMKSPNAEQKSFLLAFVGHGVPQGVSVRPEQNYHFENLKSDLQAASKSGLLGFLPGSRNKKPLGRMIVLASTCYSGQWVLNIENSMQKSQGQNDAAEVLPAEEILAISSTGPNAPDFQSATRSYKGAKEVEQSFETQFVSLLRADYHSPQSKSLAEFLGELRRIHTEFNVQIAEAKEKGLKPEDLEPRFFMHPANIGQKPMFPSELKNK